MAKFKVEDIASNRKVEGLGHLNFGPYVAHYKAHPELIEGLIERGKPKKVGSGNPKLAGVLEDQRDYDVKDKEWFIKEFQPYVDEYVEGGCKWTRTHYSEPQWTKSFSLLGLWINYMKEREYNPEHVHTGMLTWVIYLKTPDLVAERKKYAGSSYGPGGILFKYGEHTPTKWAEHTFAYDPEPGYMWIFPCPLRHEVIPFRTPGERVSVSGNLYFMHPSEKSRVEPPQKQTLDTHKAPELGG
jgi:hypothetical protein